ncbi:lysozyme [Labrenzia sp. R5_0]|uniref:lysozyme n=1 Tax=Labrenzia sp. R5_0 TaxID=2821108 RepID=UPI001ADC5591|nr:lysozyme [Labrenzia sp. R5_0]MBO9457959.1 lysozyme [Labrenzia sp. R5_0]
MFRLISDWRSVVASSLSFWMQIAGLLVLILPELWYAATGQDYNPVLAWWLGVLLLVAGVLGRIWRQGLPWWREWLRLIGVVVLVVLLALLATRGASAEPVSEIETLRVAVPFIAKEEGKRNEAYLDVVRVPTICYGSTRGVSLGMKMTDAECLQLLREEVAEYRRGLHAYFNLTTKYQRLTPERDAAYTSTAFNCGIRAIGRSTATRRLNAGDIRGGCKALTWWNKAGGRVLRGLVNRRERERALCLQGL